MNTGAQRYAQTQKTAMTAREAEAFVLKKSAYLIEQALGRPEDAGLFRQAWDLTHEMWGIIRREVLRDDCPLPPELRANIVSLAIYVDKRLVEAAHAEDAAPLESVVGINRHLAEGLSGNGVPDNQMGGPAMQGEG